MHAYGFSNTYGYGDEMVNCPSCGFNGLYQGVVFVAFFLNGDGREFVMAIGDFYELDGVGCKWGEGRMTITRGTDDREDVWS